MEKPNIMKVLEDAKLAHKSGDFTNALKFYEHFFDHALDDDPYALYGVRLSYCLDGWAELAKDFVGAHNQLVEKQQTALQNYHKIKLPELFHDYYSISRVLDKKEESLDSFLSVLQENFKNASRLVKFVWQDLIEAEQWEVCNQFLEDPVQKMDESFSVFDEASQLRNIDTSFATPAFEKHILNELVDAVNELLLVLRHNNRSEDVDVIQRKFYEIAHSRSHSGLDSLLQAKGVFLFSGH
jgi:hypothetical protein